MKAKNPVLLSSYIMILSSSLILILNGWFAYSTAKNNLKRVQNSVKPESVTNQINNKKLIPDGFPDNFPVIVNSTMENFWVNQNPKIVAYSVIWHTRTSFDKAVEFYKKELISWNLTVQNDTDSSFTGSFDSGETAGFVGITKTKNSKVLISVTLGVRK